MAKVFTGETCETVLPNGSWQAFGNPNKGGLQL